MARNVDRVCTAPCDDDLDLRLIGNAAGLAITVLPTGSLFAIEHQHERSRIMLNQVLGSPLDGGIGRLYLRIGRASSASDPEGAVASGSAAAARWVPPAIASSGRARASACSTG